MGDRPRFTQEKNRGLSPILLIEGLIIKYGVPGIHKNLTPIECRIKSRSDYTDFRSGFYIFYY